MSTSDTPRVDAFGDMTSYDWDVGDSEAALVPADFARQLERELNEARDEIKKSHFSLTATAKELNEARKDSERLDWLEKQCTGASDSERYLPFRIYWKQKGIRAAIDAAKEVGQ